MCPVVVAFRVAGSRTRTSRTPGESSLNTWARPSLVKTIGRHQDARTGAMTEACEDPSLNRVACEGCTTATFAPSADSATPTTEPGGTGSGTRDTDGWFDRRSAVIRLGVSVQAFGTHTARVASSEKTRPRTERAAPTRRNRCPAGSISTVGMKVSGRGHRVRPAAAIHAPLGDGQAEMTVRKSAGANRRTQIPQEA